MASANCTIVGRLKGDGSFDTTNAAYVGYGNLTTPDLYPYWLKFTVPTFTGASSAVTFTLSMLRGMRNGQNSSTVNLRWALCTSDANIASYNTAAACGGVSDPYQIASGTVTFDGLTNAYSAKTLTIPTTALKSGVSYFLVLWGDSSAGHVGDTATMDASTKHSAALEYNSGVVRIRRGSEWKTGIVYIRRGSEWKVGIPYVRRGNEWKVGS